MTKSEAIADEARLLALRSANGGLSCEDEQRLFDAQRRLNRPDIDPSYQRHDHSCRQQDDRAAGRVAGFLFGRLPFGNEATKRGMAEGNMWAIIAFIVLLACVAICGGGR